MKRISPAIVLLCTAVAVFGQETSTLKRAIAGSMDYLIGKLEPGTRVKIEASDFSAPPAVSRYVIQEMTAFLEKDGSLTLVERSELESLRKELDFQSSGQVSDKTGASIGKIVPPQTAISGSLSPLLGNRWRMEIKAVEIETALVQSRSIYTIKDPLLLSLVPKTTGEKIETGALNIVFGLGSYLEGDLAGGLTITGAYTLAAGLFIIEAAALDRDSPGAGVPATIGVTAAGLTVVYGFARPFIYNRNPQAVAFLDRMRIDAVPASDKGYGGRNRPGIRLAYTMKF
ncbi:MAG: CsgG/HfaB family protein [Treponema sp.]|jgi:hypothetical protein|nr:CsgG/HfaB family protein [Treponema sp.]